jgi:AcrR family transcriptional regulator
VRAIAERAGVSPALVIHHFGSKERLRAACDAFVAGFVRERKVEAMKAGPGLDPLALLRDDDDRLPLLAYLARALQDGSPAVAALVDEMVADAEAVLAAGVASGMVRPLDHPRGVAAVLTLWSLGALVLHEHARRVLGTDLTGPMSSAALSAGYTVPAMEILTHGLVAPGMYERLAHLAAGSAQARRRGPRRRRRRHDDSGHPHARPGQGLRPHPRARRARPRGAGRARCTASSGRTAPASRPPSACSWTCCGPRRRGRGLRQAPAVAGPPCARASATCPASWRCPAA